MGYAVIWRGHNYDYGREMERKAQSAKIRNAQMLDFQRCRCPNCRSSLNLGVKVITCSNLCGFTFFRTIAGVNIPVDEIIQVLHRRQSSIIQGFYSKKTGSKFNARLYWSPETNSIKFAFS